MLEREGIVGRRLIVDVDQDLLDLVVAQGLVRSRDDDFIGSYFIF